MEQQERCVLNSFYQNAAMGMDATLSILNKVQHPTLRDELCKQLRYYESQKQNLRQQMQEHGSIPQEQSGMAKLCANLSVQMHCMGGAETGEVAKLMLKGTNTGVIQLTQVIHRHPEIPDKLKRQGKEMVRHEEAYMERLKSYL